MKRLIFAALILIFVPHTYGATKGLTSGGQAKLTDWAQRVARIYGTAKKHMSGITGAETLSVYVYGNNADGFSVSGYARASYNNTNITYTPGCLRSSVTKTPGNPGCFPNSYAFQSVVEYGAYGDGRKDIVFEPEDQYKDNGTGSCLGAGGAASVNIVCVKGVKKYTYTDTPSKGVWSAFSVLYPESYANYGSNVCVSGASVTQAFTQINSIPCNTKDGLAGIKQVLESYRSYLTTCNNGVLPDRINSALNEVNTTLDEIQNGVSLVAGTDYTGDTNPTAAKNPWTFVNPTLATEGDTYQEQIPGNEVANKFKARVSGASIPSSVGFSVGAVPANNWSFVPGNSGQPVVRDVANGIAETGFMLGTEVGIYNIKATCAECCPGEVSFTAKALTENEATRLEEVFCDGSYFAGQQLPYPSRVRAYNKFTKQARSNLTVNFTKTPDKGSLSVPASQTDGKGIARTWLTLGPLGPNITRERYTITANCPDCLANPTVTCPVEAVEVPEQVNPQTDLELFKEDNGVAVSVIPNVVAPQGTEGGKEAVVTIQTTPNTSYTATIYTVPFSGGHQHNVDRPVGSWKNNPGSQANVYTGTTDGAGKAMLTYVSGVASGEERIEVTTADSKRGQKFVFVRVVGMTALPRSGKYILNGQRDGHPNNHYGTAGMISNLELLAEDFKSATAHSLGGVLSINDMGLISGGVFDTKQNWMGDNSNTHLCHRNGTSVDLDRGAYKAGIGLYRIKNMAHRINSLLILNPQVDCRVVFEKRNAAGKCMVHLECPSSPVTCSSSQTDCEE